MGILERSSKEIILIRSMVYGTFGSFLAFALWLIIASTKVGSGVNGASYQAKIIGLKLFGVGHETINGREQASLSFSKNLFILLVMSGILTGVAGYLLQGWKSRSNQA